MKQQIVHLLFLTILVPALLFAQEKTAPTEKPTESAVISGYLVDYMCASNFLKSGSEKAREKAAKHTRSCALDDGCKESGYGLISEGKWIKFDAEGDKLAVDYLEKSEKKNNFLVDVTGSMKEKVLMVEAITDAKPAEEMKGGEKKQMKKDTKKEK